MRSHLRNSLFKIIASGIVALCCLEANAQIVFSTDDLPSQFGWHSRAYVTTSDVDVSTRIGQPGGPQRWDFWQPLAAGEIVKRLDIMPITNSWHGTNFPQATYAERLTTEADGAQSWSYYRIVSDQGRAYYGFYDSVGNPVKPLKAFQAATIDLPHPILFGQTWSRIVDFEDIIDTGLFQLQVAVHFVAQAQMDAYGTLVLPRIGEVPALRVNELHTYELTDLSLGLPLGTQYIRNYYWLVRGIGKAVDLISEVQTSTPPVQLSTAKTVLRVFEFSSRSATDLHIHLKAGCAILDWQLQTNTSGYRVEMLPNLALTNWQVVAEPTNNSWADVLMPAEPQRFFRVFLKP